MSLRCFEVLVRLLDRGRDEHGQTTAEYALVIVGAAAVASLVLAWAGKTHTISRLFDATVGAVVDRLG